MKRLLALFVGIMILNISAINAQPPVPGGGPGPMDDDTPEKRAMIHKKMRDIMIYKLTDILAMNEEQAIRFFSRFNKFQDESFEVLEKLNENSNDLRKSLDSGASDADLKKLIDENTHLSNKVHSLRMDFNKNIEEVLNTEQMAKFIVFESRFHRRMRDAVREQRGKRGRGRHGRGWAE